MELPHMTPVPVAADAKCLCPKCLDEVQMLADPAVIKDQYNQIDAAIRAAARTDPPADAKPGEWLPGQLDREKYSGGYFIWTGPTLWIPKILLTARFLLFQDLGRSQ
jgi:hypothetical protein